MNDTMTLSQRADALEQKMSDELDYIVIKSRLYSTADADMSPAPNATLVTITPTAPPPSTLGEAAVSEALKELG